MQKQVNMTRETIIMTFRGRRDLRLFRGGEESQLRMLDNRYLDYATPMERSSDNVRTADFGQIDISISPMWTLQWLELDLTQQPSGTKRETVKNRYGIP